MFGFGSKQFDFLVEDDLGRGGAKTLFRDANKLLRKIENVYPNNPWFLLVHANDAHGPYAPIDRTSKEKELFEAYRSTWDTQVWKKGAFEDRLKLLSLMKSMYERGVTSIDHYAAKFIDDLFASHAKNIRDIVVIFISDHGEHFSMVAPWTIEHDGHASEEILKTPCFILNKKGDLRVSTEPSNGFYCGVDVFNTLLNFADVEVPTWSEGSTLLSPPLRTKYEVTSAYDHTIVSVEPSGRLVFDQREHV